MNNSMPTSTKNASMRSTIAWVGVGVVLLYLVISLMGSWKSLQVAYKKFLRVERDAQRIQQLTMGDGSLISAIETQIDSSEYVSLPRIIAARLPGQQIEIKEQSAIRFGESFQELTVEITFEEGVPGDLLLSFISQAESMVLPWRMVDLKLTSLPLGNVKGYVTFKGLRPTSLAKEEAL